MPYNLVAGSCLLLAAKFNSDLKKDAIKQLIDVSIETRKSGDSEILVPAVYFYKQTCKFLLKYNLLRFQISGGLEWTNFPY